MVTGAFVVDGPEALAAQLGLSPAKLAAFGWVSEMCAAEAAATLIDTYEGGWGLAILGDLHASADVYGDETGQTFVALWVRRMQRSSSASLTAARPAGAALGGAAGAGPAPKAGNREAGSRKLTRR